ncbi:MAG: tRNA(Met) cytidine acetyltransferase [Natronomonas sp.]|jgi:tRNA(Met) cytidine acetyltransferase
MDLAARLRAEACRTDERRLLVLAGTPARTRERAADALQAADIAGAPYLGPAATAPASTERLSPDRATALLGTTHEAVVVDCHEACRPNALGRAVGAVDGGGLLLLLTPPLPDWPDRRDGFDATLAVPPFDQADVSGHFRRRLVDTLRAHRGVAIVDVEAGTVEREGLTDPPPRRPAPAPEPPGNHRFPAGAYEACLTADQTEAVAAFETFETLVLEADRGRGKSSAAGLAAACLAHEGEDVLVTAPAYHNAGELFARARELLVALGALAGQDTPERPRRLETADGQVRFCPPAEAVALPDDPDTVVVDEAAALPVGRLEALLDAPAVAFATTVHGYEGAGRGFDVRFRDRLADRDRPVQEARLDTPIRHAPADPVEVWAFRALALAARPPVGPLVADADPGSVGYRHLPAEALLADDHLLREAFGLLVTAHYRTEPNDLARLLDAPNVAVRALLHDGHVVSVALLAREGGLPADRRARMYAGERVRGHMVPDVLTTQCRDERAAVPVGWRTLRVATHPVARSRGLGSLLLERVRVEAADRDHDYLSVSYGATPGLVDFWAESGFRTVHLSTTRNERSGEHSAVMVAPISAAGRALLGRHTGWFLQRTLGALADSISGADPDVVRAVLRATADPARVTNPDGDPDTDTALHLVRALSAPEWRVVAGTAEGAAVFDTAPRPFRRLALHHLAGADPATDDSNGDSLGARAERLLVAKALQARPWPEVADALGYSATTECKRAMGRVAGHLVDRYGTEAAREERRRLR